MEKRYSGRRRRHLRWLWLLMIPVLAAGYTLWRFGPQRSYTARQLGLTDLQSPNDADGDGVDDWTDAVLGARAYIATDPHYQSKYYAGGYPDDGLGVCTDVIWQALQAAGYDLKALVDADIAACPEAYPHITTPDSNIDFRRVNTLDTFFRRHAQVLTCDLSDGQQWQPGDIVVFGDRVHIGLCSDRRNRHDHLKVFDGLIPHLDVVPDGVFEHDDVLIHHGNPIDEAVERNDIPRMTVTGHFRWLG